MFPLWVIHHIEHASRVASATFSPVEVHAFAGPGGHPRAGDGACGLQFQLFDPSLGEFVAYFLGAGAAGTFTAVHGRYLGDEVYMVPPSDETLWKLDFDIWIGPPLLPANVPSLLGDSPWRVVDEHNAVVTTFDGPYAVSARELG